MNKIKSDEHIDPIEKICVDKSTNKECGNHDEHTHNFIEIEYIWKGTGCQVINNITYQVKRGDLFFFNFGDSHSYYSDDEMGIFNCLINPDFVSNEFVTSENAMDIITLISFTAFNCSTDYMLPKISFYGRELIEIENILEYMLNEFTDKSEGYIYKLKCYLNILIVNILRRVRSRDSLDLYGNVSKITPRILEYIEENYNKDITLKDIAMISSYNPTYFSKLFKDCFGRTIIEYINEIRINSAMQMIKETDSSIENICRLVGYTDRTHFYKLFKDFVGLTPAQYRAKAAKK